MCDQGKRDYQECVTTAQTDGWTDARQSDPYVLLCFAGDTKLALHIPVNAFCIIKLSDICDVISW